MPFQGRLCYQNGFTSPLKKGLFWKDKFVLLWSKSFRFWRNLLFRSYLVDRKANWKPQKLSPLYKMKKICQLYQVPSNHIDEVNYFVAKSLQLLPNNGWVQLEIHYTNKSIWNVYLVLALGKPIFNQKYWHVTLFLHSTKKRCRHLLEAPGQTSFHVMAHILLLYLK